MSKIPPERISAFAAGGFALMFSQAFVRGICDFVASAIAGKFLWPLLIGAVVTGLGVALGVALLAGRSWALRLARIFLILVVAGECLSFIYQPLFHIQQPGAWKTVSDLVVNLTILPLLGWKTPNPRIGCKG
jgi:hypothetical protein